MPLTGFHHLSLTVRDLEASVTWYAELLQLDKFMEETHDGGRAVILARPEAGLFLGLHRHEGTPADRFDETRTGLDHVAIGVADHAELEGWARTLDDQGIPHSPIADRPWGSVLVFRDPDNIQLELACPPAR